MLVATYRHTYVRTVRFAFVGAIAIHLLIVWLSPPFEFKAFTMPPEPPPLIEVTFAVTEVPSEPPPDPPMPGHDLNPFYEPAPPEVEPPDLTRPEPPPVGPGRNPSPVTAEPPFPSLYDQPPKAIHMAKARYPDLAREAGIEGRVVIAILVDETGKPVAVKVVSSEVTPAMERAALDASLKSRFEPARQWTHPVRAWVAIPFDFRLRACGG